MAGFSFDGGTDTFNDGRHIKGNQPSMPGKDEFSTATGAAIGAGAGLLLGGIIGAGNAQASGYAAQSSYDAGYMRCMYASGNRVPAVAQAYPVVRPAVVYPAPYYPYYRPYYYPYW